MKILKEAGLPDGVINFIPAKGSQIGDIVLGHKDLAGIHFTGSTKVFQSIWKNDKPTGAVVGQQPFGGGARGSGTNDKAGSLLNLIRWTSARTIKENFVPPQDYRYPLMTD